MAIELILLTRVAYRDQEIPGPRVRGLLALLAADLHAGAGVGRLVAGLWPDEQPEKPTKALQILVHRARTHLGADVIVSTPTGYRLSLAEEQVDSSAALLRAGAVAQHARAGDHAQALAEAEAGLALWAEPNSSGRRPPAGRPANGPSTLESDDPVDALRAERASTYRALVRAHALALSRLGRRAEAVEALSDLVREHPQDEEVLLELLSAEATTLGPSAALVRYERYRRGLRDDLGTEPGSALQAVYRQLLQAAAPAVRHGVRHEPNSLLGRDDDLAAVGKLLHSSRVTSIVGPGGLGKTRLAHAVTRLAEQRIVYVVTLAGVTADDDVLSEVATALGVGRLRRAQTGDLTVRSDVLTELTTVLGPGPALLVLDNCEQVITGAAALVQALVSMTQDLRVLTTSRAPLGLTSESVYLLPELTLPTTVELFEQRARAARPEVDLPTEVVARLCRQLDGLPLATELAAARVRVMSIEEIDRRLQDRFALLRGGSRDSPERHRTLQAVVDWSWNLLEPAGQAALRALSVFPGGFTADAAEHVLDVRDSERILELLVDQSLLKVSDTGSGTRFRMLETVREFSAAHRDAAAETSQVTGYFLDWIRKFSLAQHLSLFGPDPFSGSEQIRAERDNLVHALRIALARPDRATAVAATAVLAGLWFVESNYSRASVLFKETAGVLSRFRPDPELEEITRTALTLSLTYTFMIEGPRAVRCLSALRRLPQTPPDSPVRGAANLLRIVPENPDALFVLADSDEPFLAGPASIVVSYLRGNDNDLEGALRAARQMLAAFTTGDSPWLRALAHGRISELCLQIEQGDEARRHLTEALPVYDRLGGWSDIIGIRWWMVLANLQVGDVDAAERWLEATPRRPDEAGDFITYGIGVRAEISLARGEIEDGLRLWRQAVNLLTDTEVPSLDDDPLGLNLWALEAKCIAVIAHVQHRQLDLLQDVADELPDQLDTMLRTLITDSAPFVLEYSLCGTILLALAMIDLDRAERTDDQDLRTSSARTIALAECFGCLRGFQPTMASALTRQATEQADPAAYADAVSTYALLPRSELRAEALSRTRRS